MIYVSNKQGLFKLRISAPQQMDGEKGGHCAAASARCSDIRGAVRLPVPPPHALFHPAPLWQQHPSPHPPAHHCETVPFEKHGVELGTLNTERGELQQLLDQKNGMSQKDVQAVCQSCCLVYRSQEFWSKWETFPKHSGGNTQIRRNESKREQRPHVILYQIRVWANEIECEFITDHDGLYDRVGLVTTAKEERQKKTLESERKFQKGNFFNKSYEESLSTESKNCLTNYTVYRASGSVRKPTFSL